MSVTSASQLAELDHPRPERRRQAVEALAADCAAGRRSTRPQGDWVNLHCHSFYSYNGEGMSPSHLVWRAKELGLAAVGLVDFDCLDGIDEFHAAGRSFGIRTVAGIETRVYLPSFAEAEINSPGEPGVAYHMGSGLCSGLPAQPGSEVAALLADLAARAKARNLGIIEAVNAVTAPVQIDYQRDVVPLTPAGNVTERHLCAAYDAAAQHCFGDADSRRRHWAQVLDEPAESVPADGLPLQLRLRARLMKRGGVGYRQPEAGSFPPLQTFNDAILQLGGLPTLTWLDGLSAGEAAVDELFELHEAAGGCAVNIIPERNWHFAEPLVKERKLAALRRFVAAAEARDWPIQVGTELNAPGLPAVDDFDAPELADFVAPFRRGAAIIFGHCVAQARDGRGYTSPWAAERFKNRADKNAYFADLGARTAVLPPLSEAPLSGERP